MRKIITTTFVTLDGVMQAPGGPQEDRSDGFQYGGWMFPYNDEATDKIMDGFLNLPFELLLGRKTYDIFASYWPTADKDNIVTKTFNATKKYVVSHKADTKTPWVNSKLITGNVPVELKKLKEMDGPDLWVHGSGELIQTLLKNELVDRMHIWIHPLILGKGKRLFQDDLAKAFTMTDAKIAKSGVIVATYEPAGAVKTGTIGA